VGVVTDERCGLWVTFIPPHALRVLPSVMLRQHMSLKLLLSSSRMFLPLRPLCAWLTKM
jgi:hypothetical protein